MRRAVLIGALFAALGIPSSARSDELLPKDVVNALNKSASHLGYKVGFKLLGCQQAEAYVCDLTIRAPTSPPTYKFLVSARNKDEPVRRFNLPMSTSDSLVAASTCFTVVVSMVGGDDVRIDEATTFLSEAMAKAREDNEPQSDVIGGAKVTVILLNSVSIDVLVEKSGS